jgi:hypothetical protein
MERSLRSRRNHRLLIFAIFVVLAVAAIARSQLSERDAPPSLVADAMSDPAEVYDPVSAGETLPDGYRRGLERDQILPVYDPVFTSAAQVDWPGDSLVIGVAGGETAKAYPVTHLNSREMVIDSLDGIPILVSW